MYLKRTSPYHPYYTSALGEAFLCDTLEFLPFLRDASVDLILTSPPFALKRKKEYGNEEEDKYCDWFMSFAPHLYRILKDEGSFVLDLGGAYKPGFPVRSIYQFELLVRLVKETGFYLAQEFYHYNPARLPAPAEWVNVRRVRVKDSVNVVWWLSKTPHPKADNRQVLRPYSDSMQSLLKNGYKAKLRPSGHDISEKFSRDNGGAIPPNLLELANTDSNGRYQQLCREYGVKVHPARFPPQFAEFFIKFLTDEGALVYDIFAGSNTTGFVAEKLARRWLATELSEEYLRGSKFRFMDKDLPVKVTKRVTRAVEKENLQMSLFPNKK
ncbi:site-specific DNA-methyltransferase [uncultured Lamprocystis sp.]|jgi:site-specific DNA-methyltransferase (cytosine-N4-specific)|uniref:DNA-methyltransferase n=1 Tax=uncultured Lamprocystis sp. TaxID=543132 RepID=UPI0025E5CE90|nr:site-specific DNA-methyltransferase [uncultured Lamprocystis sp.]